MAKRGAYVTLDGPDGVGKSSHAMRLANATNSYPTREPGGTIQQIRTILLDKFIELTPEAEVLLFSADRNITLQRTIRPQLQLGRSVVSDRSFLSTLAYQCYGRGLDLGYAKAATNLALGDMRADKIIILDAPFEVTQGRLGDRGDSSQNDRFEAEDRAFKVRVRNGFLDLAKEIGERAVVIDASGEVFETAGQIFQACGQLLIDGVEV